MNTMKSKTSTIAAHGPISKHNDGAAGTNRDECTRTTPFSDHDLQNAAKAAAGNWRDFESFAWDGAWELDDPENWTVVYTHHRDSGLLDQSNAVVIERALEPFSEGDDPDVTDEHHRHWAVGWIDGFAIRVFRNGHITQAFRAYHQLATQSADYPVLDEEDYSRREYEATMDNLTDAASWLAHEYELPEHWQDAVYTWLSENDPSAIENRNDHGGYPGEGQLMAAFESLGYPNVKPS